MLTDIKTNIFTKYKKEDIKGLFVTLYDKNNVMLASNGVIQTDKPLGQLIDILYHGIVEKFPTTQTLVAEVVQELTPQNDVPLLMTISLVDNGIFMISKEGDKSGVMLPGTAEAKDMKTALTMIKQKFWLSGDVEIYTFKTEKFTVS